MKSTNCLRPEVRLSLLLFMLLLQQSRLPVAVGQTCERWTGEPSICGRFAGYSGEEVHIYVPTNSTLAEQVAVVVATVNVVGTVGTSYSAADYCNSRYLMLSCATFLRPCLMLEQTSEEVGETTPVPVPIPIQPCKSLCQEYRSEQCMAAADELGFPIGAGLGFPPSYFAPLTCNETEFGLPFYIDERVNTTYGQIWRDSPGEKANEEFELMCNHMSANAFGLTCEEPLVKDEEKQRCSFTCPLPAYNENQYDKIQILQLTFGWLSFVGSLLVAVSYGIHPSLRTFPANLILMTALATSIATFALILPTFATHQTTWCGPDEAFLFPTYTLDETRTPVVDFKMDELLVKSDLCSFQGFVLVFGFLSTTVWWVVISFNMCITVYFGKRLPTSRAWKVSLQVAYHLVGWALPLLLALIPTAADKIAFGPGDTFCFISPEENRAYFITFWALPVAIALLVGLVLFLASIVRILILAFKLGEGKKACMTYYRLGLFILIFMVVYAFIFAYTLQVATNLDTIEEGYSEYFQCLTFASSDCSLSEDVSNYHLAALKGFAYAVLGFLLFLNFCLSEPIGKMWWKLVTGLAHGGLPSLRPTTDSTGTGKRTRSNSRSRNKSKSKVSIDTNRMTISVDSNEEAIP
ncbi:hypothetical protein QOT17_004611 [Balamuthia mandrillaris]